MIDIEGLTPADQAIIASLAPPQLNALLKSLDRDTLATSLKASLKKQFRTGISTNLEATATQTETKPKPAANMTEVINRGVVMFTVNVPFLKGLGNEGSLAAVEHAAGLAYQASVAGLQHTISKTMLDAITAYWDYVNASWYLAKVNDSKARIEEWITRARVPSNSLQSYLEDKKGKIIDAQNVLSQQQVALAQVMGISASDLQSLGDPAPDFPVSWSEQLARFDRLALESVWLSEAEQKRLDFKAAKLQLEAAGTLLKKARRDLLPSLDLALGVGYSGFTQYDGFDPLIQSFNENVRSTDYSVGLVFSYPIGNNIAEGTHDVRNAEYQQAQISTNDALRGIKLNVKGDLSNLYGRMQKAVQSEKTTLSYRASVKDVQNNPGVLSDPTRQVTAMELEDKFLASQKERADSLTDLANAIAKARFTTGTLLKADDASGMVNLTDLQTPPGW
jgi:outer membrane protein TolC